MQEVLTSIFLILNAVLALYYKFKKKDTLEALWCLGFVIMLMVSSK